jgi:hypothetical protein
MPVEVGEAPIERESPQPVSILLIRERNATIRAASLLDDDPDIGIVADRRAPKNRETEAF